MIQTGIVIAIVAICVGLTLRSLINQTYRKNGCQCSGCNKSCPLRKSK